MSPWLAALLAPFVGSFAATVALRLPQGRPVVFARSACDHCGAVLGARDLVPLLGWLLARGRCRHCGWPIPVYYPAMEGLALVVVGWAAAVTTGLVFWASCGLGWTLLALAAADARHGILPDALTLPALVRIRLATDNLHSNDISGRTVTRAQQSVVFAGQRLAFYARCSYDTLSARAQAAPRPS